MTKDDILYITDGTQGVDDLKILDTKDRKLVGQFEGMTGPHMLSDDATSTIYVAETRGASVKKFVRK